MTEYEFTGKTVEEAIEEGLKTMGLAREEAEVTVLEEGKKGGLFTKGVKARVRMRRKRSDGERAVDFLEGMFGLLGVSATTELEENEENTRINVITPNPYVLTGHRGEMLDALQVLAGAVANIGREEYKRVVVDCEGYREKREETLKRLANKLAEGSLYSREELERIDALVIMHVHDKDVYNEKNLKENYTDYQLPFDYSDYPEAYDYLIKRYLSDCYELRNDTASKYYGTTAGKPAVIILCTHWHDARTTYNASIRKLAEKWGFPLVEFDKYIGFSKQQLHPVTKEQTSLIYATGNPQVQDGVAYGWHPQSGENKYIQRRMAATFYNLMQNILY